VIDDHTATEGGPPPVDSRGDWCNCLGGPQGPWHLLGETPYCPGGADPASPQGEAQGQGEDADSDTYPWVEDLDLVWHHRPVGQPWVMDREDSANAETSCGKWVSSVHTSTHVPDVDADSVFCRDCITQLALAAPRAVAPVGNVDREALDELMWRAFKDAQVIHDGADDHDDRFRAPTMFERRRMADVALAALRGEDS
jgi:hypothetical protein